jgi:hypothetical protein
MMEAHAPEHLDSPVELRLRDLWRSVDLTANPWLVRADRSKTRVLSRSLTSKAPPGSQLGAPSPTLFPLALLFSLAHLERHQHAFVRCPALGTQWACAPPAL